MCVIGDFNSIFEESERVGASTSDSARDRRKFKEFIESCKLFDVGRYKDGNSRVIKAGGRGACKNRIDRVLINEK